MCIYMVGYALHCTSGSPPSDFRFSGERGSPAGSLDQTLGKDDSTDWLENMFGTRPEGDRVPSNLSALILRDNRDKKRTESPFLLHPDLTRYPPLSVKLFLSDVPVSSVQEIRSLLRALWKQWDGISNITPSPAELEESGASIQQATVIDSPPTSASVPTPAEPIQSTAENYQVPPAEKPSSASQIERHQTLPELLKSMTVPSIKSYIIAALLPARGSAALEIALGEILSPESINILAERLVQGSVEDFVDFYAGDYDSPPNIKHAVTAAIAANRTLRAEHALKVARSGYRNLVGWFAVFSFFCPHLIAIRVEGAFLEFASEPGFKDQFASRSLHGLTTLVSHFSKFGCAGAVHILKELCFEVIIRRIEEGDPIPNKETEPFALLVGKKIFQNRIDGSGGKKTGVELSPDA